MLYLATPYTGHPGGLEVAWRDACDAAALLLREGVLVYSPIAHTHAIAQRHELPKDYAFWRRFDEDMISASRGVIVCLLPGWNTSRGVQAEVAYASEINRPVFGMLPGRVPYLGEGGA